MKKTIRSTLLCAILFLFAAENFAQMTANAQQIKSGSSEKKSASEKKLKDVLTELKDHYNVDILFFDRYIDEYNVSSEIVRWDKTVEKNLEAVLKSTNLEFKKTSKGGFVISPKKISQSEDTQENNFLKSTDQTASSSSEQTSLIPSTMLQIPGSILVSGTVKDESGQPLPGTNVIQKGTTNGTTTDAEGKYSLNVPDDATLVFSFIGYTTVEEAVSNRSTIDISLKSDATSLNEIVVTGYGELRKSDVTSAQSTISSKDINLTVNTTFDQAIQGRAPGVYVTQNTGTPGGGVSVTIRGVSSLMQTTEPLYVIDGIQIQGGTSTSGTNPMSMLNPSDIESMEVLQGPNATSVYGSRGSNGVIVITTKRGKSGAVKVNYGYSYSLQDQPKNLDIMNLQQFAQMQVEYKTAIGDKAGIREEFKDPSLLGPGSNWQNALFQRAAMHKHQLSFSGGTDKSTYYLSGERLMQDGVALNSGYDRSSLSLNTDTKVRDWLSIATNIRYTDEKRKLGTMGSGQWNNLILNALQLGPDIPIYNLDGTYGAGNPNVSTTQQYTPPNPVGLANLVTSNLSTRTFLANLTATVRIIKGLEFRTNANTNINYGSGTTFYPTYHFSAYQQNPVAKLTETSNQFTSWLWNQMLTYNKEINRHHINAMATHEANYWEYRNLSGYRQNFPTNNILDLNLGDPSTASNSGGQGNWALESYLGRINYSFDNRYIVTATIRADGSSSFGPANKWGVFPSASAAWRISNEKFFSVPAINDLRLRFETGVTGNQNIPGNPIYGNMTAAGASQFGVSFSPNVYPNPFIKWEPTLTNNFGLTLGILSGKIQLEADYYLRKTDNLTMPSSLPFYMGTSGTSAIQPPVVNVGGLQNNGWSVSISTKNINTGNFKWTSVLNVSAFQPKITALTTGNAQIVRTIGQPKGNEPFQSVAIVGQAPWQFLGNVSQGLFKDLNDVNNSPRPVDNSGNILPVNQSNIWVGDMKYKDINGDGKIDSQDLTTIGNPWPKWFGGFTNTFSYKGFDLTMLITFSYGNQIYNLTRDEETNPNNINLGRNMFVTALDYAKLSTTDPADNTVHLLNPNSTVPRLQGTKGLNNNYDRYTSNYVEDGSYTRLKNLTIGYNLPASLIGKQKVIQGVRIAVSGQNLFTWTNYRGYDPEVGAYTGPSYGGDNLTSTLIGVDYGRYPLTRVYSFNLAIDF